MAKSKYDPETFPKIAKALVEKGCTNKEIIDALGISEAHFYNLINRHKEFKESIYSEVDSEKIINDVEAALYKRAKGYNVEETKTVERLDYDTGVFRVVETIKTIKHIPGDVRAQEIYLTNKSDKWMKNPDNRNLNENVDKIIKSIEDGVVQFNKKPEEIED